MAFPYELLQYAENFYRRFPEEFIALGAPGLEEIYDLRPNSTLSRRIQDTPTEKSVEITIRRWQTPSLSGGMSHSYGYPQANSFGLPPHSGHLSAIGVLQQQAACLSASPTAGGHYGHSLYNVHHGMPASGPNMGLPHGGSPATPPRWEAELKPRLSRLEGALTKLKPQIEMLLSQPQEHGYSLPQVPQRTSAPQFAGSSDDAPIHQETRGGMSPVSGGTAQVRATSLASRRGAAGLAIQTAPAAQQPMCTEAPAKPAAVPLQIATKPPAPAQVAQSGASPKDDNLKVDIPRPSVSINPVRVAPGFQDPQSPRSPGRYTAWK